MEEEDKNEAKPFFFKFLLNNNKKLSDLEEKNNTWNTDYKKDFPLEIFLNKETFSIWFTRGDGKDPFELKNLKEETTLFDLE